MLTNKKIQTKILTQDVRLSAFAMQLKRMRNEILSLRAKVNRLEKGDTDESSANRTK